MCIDYRLRNIDDAEDAANSDDDDDVRAVVTMEFWMWHVLCGNENPKHKLIAEPQLDSTRLGSVQNNEPFHQLKTPGV